MSARLTVVLDDEELYRRLKVKAALDGVPMKELIERGLRLVVDMGAAPAAEAKAFDWDDYESMLKRLEDQDEALGLDEAALPEDLSDIKRHLYGWPARAIWTRKNPHSTTPRESFLRCERPGATGLHTGPVALRRPSAPGAPRPEPAGSGGGAAPAP